MVLSMRLGHLEVLPNVSVFRHALLHWKEFLGKMLVSSLDIKASGRVLDRVVRETSEPQNSTSLHMCSFIPLFLIYYL
jgi:hypothetical protein